MNDHINMSIEQPNNAIPADNRGQSGKKMFTQDDVNRIVSERLARERVKAEAEKVLTSLAEKAITEALTGNMKGMEFINDITRDYFVAEMKKVISAPANKGKETALFHDMIKDRDNIFKNPQHEHIEIPGVTGNWETGNWDHRISAAFGLKK